jgi:hypothetical protein
MFRNVILLSVLLMNVSAPTKSALPLEKGKVVATWVSPTIDQK